MELITDKEMVGIVSQAIHSFREVSTGDKTKALIELLTTNDDLKMFVNAVVLEAGVKYLEKGVDLAKTEKSILTMPENLPLLVRDSETKGLIIVVPVKGEYLLVDGVTKLDIKPECWYDVPLFSGQDGEHNGRDNTRESNPATT